MSIQVSRRLGLELGLRLKLGFLPFYLKALLIIHWKYTPCTQVLEHVFSAVSYQVHVFLRGLHK